MVNIFALRFGPLLRVLNHRIRAGRLRELRQFLSSGNSSRPATAAVPWSQTLSQQPPLVFQMASGYWVSQAIYAAAKLGIADVLTNGPKSVDEIANAVEADADSLRRLLRVLSMLNVCQITKSEEFELTALGRALQSGVSGSLRAIVLTLGELHYKAWGHLCESVQTGHPGFCSVFGSPMFDFLEKNSNSGEIFNLAMTDFSAFVAHALLVSYDFSGIKSLVDVGGGCGKLLTSILEVYPTLQGVILDLPGVVGAACERIRSHACRDRCAAISGNFFQSIPRGGDLYLLSGVIHDWDDQAAELILKNCRDSMRPQGRVLAVECIVPESDEPSFSKLLDLNMMVMTGGRERTEREFRELFGSSGLSITKVVSTPSPLRIIEAVRN
jgi:O-methyltransferase/methyltransferase family protein